VNEEWPSALRSDPCTEAISSPRNRFQEDAAPRGLAERSAEPRDGLIQTCIGDVDIGPQEIEQLFRRYQPACVSQQMREQQERLRLNRYGSAVFQELAAREIDLELTEPIAALGSHRGSKRLASRSRQNC